MPAVSPDRLWRWDGIAWRRAQAPARSNRRLIALIGAGMIAALLLAGAGGYLFTRVLQLEQSGLAGVGRACQGSADPAGTALHAHDTVCGYRLGTELVSGSCAGAATIPDGTRGWQKGRGDTAATNFDMVVDSEGCDLDTPVGTTIWLQTTNQQAPDVVVIVDYVPRTDWGEIGIELACNGVTCVDFFIDPAGIYRLDEEHGSRQWSTIARGPLPLFTISRLGQLNRMVVRYRDRNVQAFLNGYSVVRATTSLVEPPGFVSVYSADVIGTEPALVHVRSFDVFATA